jgi:Sec-independent protein translocase protein TatA
MFEISWGEIFVVGAVGAAVTGRKDLPAACRLVGSQLGRMVGLLQGARVRADQFTAQNEMKQLQNELRSGLRELDQVRTELAIAASTQGMVGKTLGASTSSANRMTNTSRSQSQSATTAATTMTTSTTMPTTTQPLQRLSVAPPPQTQTQTAMSTTTNNNTIGQMASAAAASQQSQRAPTISISRKLPPVAHTERAVLEDEWEKRGIGFRAKAEQHRSSSIDGSPSGSELLEHLIKQNLIFDQYDRVVGQQDAQLQDRIEGMKEKRRNDKEIKTKEKKKNR